MKVKMSRNAPAAHDTLVLEEGERLMKPTIMRQTKIPTRPPK
jgi:hypothetical protein